MKLGFIYSGQGAQVAGMGKDFYDNEAQVRAFYDEIDVWTDIKKYSFTSSLEEISQTEITQMVLVAYHIMITDLLREKGIVPSSTIGLSIGEYSSLYAANVLAREDAVRIAVARGRFMGEISGNTAMYAVLKASESEISEILSIANEGKDAGEAVYIANYNCPGQIVISGAASTCENAVAIFEERGIKAVRLNVSGAFHTPFMKAAAVRLAELFESIDFKEKSIPVFTNLTGKDDEITKEMMVRQVQSPVRFEQAVSNMLDSGIDMIIEIGYNNTIKNLIKRIDRKAKVLSISDYESFSDVVKGVCDGE